MRLERGSIARSRAVCQTLFGTRYSSGKSGSAFRRPGDEATDRILDALEQTAGVGVGMAVPNGILGIDQAGDLTGDVETKTTLALTVVRAVNSAPCVVPSLHFRILRHYGGHSRA